MNTRILLLFLATTVLPFAVACGGDVSGTGPDGAAGCSGAAVAALPQGCSIDATEITRCQYQA